MPVHLKLDASIKHVWSLDPNLDHDAEGFVDAYKRHLKERTDESLAAIPVKPGGSPAVFTLKPLTKAQFYYLRGVAESVRDLETVALGLGDVSGLYLNGLPVVFKTQDSAQGARAAEPVMDALFRLGNGLLTELYKQIGDVTFPDPTRG